MTWVRIDDQFTDHPKVVEVGPLAECLFVRGLAYAARYLTDGFVPASHLRRMGDMDAIEEAGRLVSVGLWHEAPSGYRIHDYLDYQPSAEKVKAEREAARERMDKARSGKRTKNAGSGSGEVQLNLRRTSDNPTPIPTPKPEVPNGTSSPQPPKRTDRKRPEVAKSEHPYELLESLCDALGVEVTDLGDAQKRKQLGVAKRLMADGMTETDMGRIVQWLRSQTWMTGGIDMFTVERNLAKWTLEGKPVSVAPNGSLTVVKGGKVGRDGRTDEERGYRENPGPKGWTGDELAAMSHDPYLKERSGT